MLDFDSSVQPRRISEWLSLLDAVYRADPSDEKTWLEWKSRLDLRSKENMATIVAKAIIAFANRNPDRAAETTGGIGVLIIGLEPGAVHGVTKVDNADLDKLISPYVGAEGPIWEPHWTEYAGKPVLIIEVAAPQWGDRIHTFRKEFGNIRSGTAYVRKLARSVPAAADDIDRLAERFAAGIRTPLNVTVGVRYPQPLSRYRWMQSDLDMVLHERRKGLLRDLPDTRFPEEHESSVRDGQVKAFIRPRAITSSLGDVFSQQIPEHRTPIEFEKEVEEYARAIAQRWPAMMQKLAARFIRPPRFVLTNPTTKNFHQVQVAITLPDGVEAAEYEQNPPGFDFEKLMPERPRSWGPRPLRTDDMILGMQFGQMATLWRPPPSMHFSVEVRRDSGVMLTFPPVDLRPHGEVVLADDWCVIASTSHEDPVVASWTATATNADGPPATGSFVVDFTGPHVDVMAEVMRLRDA
ncbi:ATP-binding protein [Actinoplanes sp. NPDC023714]|uniref:AlbA family DNA-binding domain-containing protein n=1 Tax=Actinoplanes sp. NPDC023714 TaxID=3154322 RepID=UPI003400961E